MPLNISLHSAMANNELRADDDKPELARRQALIDEWRLPAISSVDDLCSNVAKLCQQAGLCPHILSHANENKSTRPISTNTKLNSHSEVHDRVIENTNGTTKRTSVRSITSTSYDAQVASALGACDIYSMSARAAAATISVIGDERLSLADETAALDARVARDELDIQRLRTQLRREALIVEYYKELESLAKQIAQHPSLPQLSEELAQARATSASIDVQINALDNARIRIAKELTLLSRAAHAVSECTQNVSNLVLEQPQTNPQTNKTPSDLVSPPDRETPTSKIDDQPTNSSLAGPTSSEMFASSTVNEMDTS